MLTVVTGALAGAFHVLSGPDHLAAVAPLSANARRRGWIAGCTWGLGHASGVVTVAFLAVIARDALPDLESLSAWGERIVGGVLVALGLWALQRSWRVRSAAHAHGAFSHDHLHVQAGPAWARRLGHGHTAFVVGVLHGVAGTSHFLGVLPALALPSRWAAMSYVGAFGVGTVAAMALFAAVVGRVGSGTPQAARALMAASGAAAVLVGAVWLVT